MKLLLMVFWRKIWMSVFKFGVCGLGGFGAFFLEACSGET